MTGIYEKWKPVLDKMEICKNCQDKDCKNCEHKSKTAVIIESRKYEKYKENEMKDEHATEEIPSIEELKKKVIKGVCRYVPPGQFKLFAGVDIDLEVINDLQGFHGLSDDDMIKHIGELVLSALLCDSTMSDKEKEKLKTY